VPMTHYALTALEEAAQHIAPDTALGGALRDRKGLIKKLTAHARYLRGALTAAYGALVALPLAAAAIFFVWRPLLDSPRAATAVGAGLAVLITLLEFSRRMTREYMTLILALDAAPHATDAQLANFISTLLDALTAADKTRTAAKKPRLASPKNRHAE
jgi:hypothetical protein